VRADVIDRLLHGSDLFRLFVRNFAFEFVFQRHDQFDRVQRVRAEILDERRFVLDIGFVDAELLGNDLLDAGSMFSMAPPGTQPAAGRFD